MGIERLDDNGNSILRLPRSGFSFSGRGDRRQAATSVACLRRWLGDDLLPPLPVERKRFIACPARIGTIRRVMAGPFVGPFAFEKLRVATEENSRGIKYPLRLHVSPYAIAFSLFLSHHFVS